MVVRKAEKQKARVFVDRVLSNTHESLKSSWQIVMGFSMIVAVQEFYGFAFEGTKTGHEYIQATVFAPVVFLLTYVRFFLGDNRYLDLHYIELRQWGDIDDYLADLQQTLSPWRSVIDVGLLLTHGIAFVFLAKSIGHPSRFIGFYVLLWASNICWLYTMVRMNLKREPLTRLERGLIGADREATESPRRDRTLEFWIKNNTTCLLVVAALYWFHTMVAVFDRLSFQYACMVVFLANSFFDFYGTHTFYWPNLVRTYDDAIKEIEETQDS